jgi:hypothetical protein
MVLGQVTRRADMFADERGINGRVVLFLHAVSSGSSI